MTFRSLEMKHYQMIIPRQQAYNTISQLGQQQLVHFLDSGDPLNRPFQQQLKRCDETLHKISAMIAALKKEQIVHEEYDDSQPLFVEQLFKIWEKEINQLSLDEQKLLEEYENQVDSEYNKFLQLSNRIQKLKGNLQGALEKIACYETVQSFFGNSKEKRMSQEYYLNNSADQPFQVKGVSFMVGVVEPAAQLRLSRMIYRISRGYAVTKSLDEFNFKGLFNFEEKVILVIYPTTDSSVLQKKLFKALQTFCKSCFRMSDLEGNINENLIASKKQYQEIISYIELNKKQYKGFLDRIKEINQIEKWRIYLWKEKYIYETLNKLQIRQQFYIGNIYIPAKDVKKLLFKLNMMMPSPTLQELPLGKAPTQFNTNSYTGSSQMITNTYGVPRYQEVNPSIFTTITFPFFFGVMFGDIGHGGLLFCFGLYLIFFDESVKKGSLKLLSQLRYMIALMGFFAFYCGWIYNDLIGFNTNFFGSCFNPPPAVDEQQQGGTTQKAFYPAPDCIYPFGIDPIWGRAENNLIYVNGLKMKISVIIAIIHMTMGICVKAFNAKYFRSNLDFIFQFIPQFIFLVILFGYMDFLIIFKWLKVWDQRIGDIPPQQWAPSIITTMMNIGLKMGETGTDPNGQSNMFGQRGNSIQDTIQLVILGVAFLCIPIMLLPKPLILINQNKKHANKKATPKQEIEEIQEGLQEKLNPTKQKQEQHDGEHDSGEIMVHQLIETIQFVLGAVSNTASYLRLWALSLAHSQLALVFFEKTLLIGFALPGTLLEVPVMFVMFYALCWVTFGVLMCMDSMECFLHSLRLHWVEFQNKFYKGDGYQYQPISFKKYITQLKGQ